MVSPGSHELSQVGLHLRLLLGLLLHRLVLLLEHHKALLLHLELLLQGLTMVEQAGVLGLQASELLLQRSLARL